MACLRLGSKSETLRREGHTWICTSGLASDVTIEIGEMSFQLHKFPLISRSGLLEKKIGEVSSATMDEGSSLCAVKLDDIPGGSKSFELVTKFCYGMKLELTALNVVSVRCAAEYLEMTEEYGEDNLISLAENFLNEVFNCWNDSMKALESCEEVLIYAEETHVVSRCINSLAVKACADPTLFNWPLASPSPRHESGVWNGIRSTKSKPITDDWWYDDVSFLSLPLYKRLIKSVESRGMKPERVAGSLMFYANRYLPSMNRQSSFKEPATGLGTPTPPESDQRNLLEEIVGMLPSQKGVTHTKFLLRLLRSAMALHASPACMENLEKRVGIQLDQASMVDLLMPNMGYATEMLYDVDCVQRIVDHFMADHLGLSGGASPQIVAEEAQAVDGSQSLTSVTVVAELVDSYLAEVAPDVNLKLPKFQALAAVIPDYARPRYDGLYRAIDIYLKAHPWMTDSEREQICRIMNFQKLSVEASTHAAQNERLPLRVVVQVLFFEQLRLRTQISGWLFVSENLDSSQHHQGDADDPVVGMVEDVKDRVSELEKECVDMRQEINKLGKTKRRWSMNIFSRMFHSRRSNKAGINQDSKAGFQRAVRAAMVKQQQQQQQQEQREQGNGNVSDLDLK